MLRERLEAALRGHDADFVEIRVEETEATQLSYRDRELDEVGRSLNLGGSVRAAYKGGWGFVSFNDLSDLPEKAALAVRQARLVGKERTELAPVPPVVDVVPLVLRHSPFDVPLADKKRMMDEYIEVAWGRSPKVQTTNAGYADTRRKVTVANSEGTYVEQERARCRATVQVLAREDGNVQQSRAAFSSIDDFSHLLGRQEEVAEATDRAVALLGAAPATGGEYTVICDPKLAAVFAHEAFGHLSEGDNVYENERLRQVMVLGRRFGREHLNIADGASIPEQPGSFKYDDEGTPTQKTYLIKEGVLVGRLHSRETAGKMGGAGHRQRPGPVLPPPAPGADDQHRDRAGQVLLRGDAGRDQAGHLLQGLVRRLHHPRAVRLLLRRGLDGPRRQAGRAPPRHHPLRQPLHHPGEHRHDRAGLRMDGGRRDVRQGRPERPRGPGQPLHPHPQGRGRREVRRWPATPRS